MSAHVDILDQADSLNKPLLGSVALHAAIFGTLLLAIGLKMIFFPK